MLCRALFGSLFELAAAPVAAATPAPPREVRLRLSVDVDTIRAQMRALAAEARAPLDVPAVGGIRPDAVLDLPLQDDRLGRIIQAHRATGSRAEGAPDALDAKRLLTRDA